MSYLASVFLFGTIWLYLFCRCDRLRACMVVSGLLFLPAGLTEALFVPVYWDPRVVGRAFGMFDLESLLFAFFTGGIAPVLYPAFLARRLEPLPSRVSGWRMHLFWVMPALAVLILIGFATYTSLSAIHTAFGIFLLGIAHMLLVRPDLLKASLWGALLFFGVYSGVLAFSVLLFGEPFLGAWKTKPLFGLRLFGLPIDEFVYALLFGALWSTVYCGIFNCRFTRPAPKQATGLSGKTRWSRRMPRIFFLTLCFLLIALPAPPPSSGSGADRAPTGPVIESSLRSGYAEAAATGTIRGSTREVWAVLTDYRHLADYMPSVKECRVQSRSDGSVRLYYKIGVSIFTISYTAELTEVRKYRYQTWRLLEGSLRMNNGSWRLAPVGRDLTRLTYHVRISHRFFPDALLLRLLRSRLPEVYRAIQQRVEENENSAPQNR